MHLTAILRAAAGALVILAADCGGKGTAPAVPPPAPPDSAPPSVALQPPTLPPMPGCPATPTTPLAYGGCVLEKAKTRAKSDAKVMVFMASDPAAHDVAVDAPAESYSIVQHADETWVVARDAVGAMYGALDVAERLDAHGASALPIEVPVKASPLLAIRAANIFLVLPEAGQPAWWFRDPVFWTEYLDMMARARLDFLDIHAMYDLRNTEFANPLFWFATSASSPETGVPRSEREANVAMLNQVIQMAAVRGIKVGLMSYRASLSAEDNGKETPEETAMAPTYTREAVADLAARAPGLAYFGFRVGESQRTADWYASTYLAGLKQAHSRAIPYTRSWKTTKKELLGVVAESGPETILEVKYNGEHLGPPYVVSGGGMEKWKTYSYEDLLEPPAPYRFVFQVRAGGTHRVFRYASYARTRRAIMAMTMSPRVAGFTLEAAHAYFPQRDYYHADPADSFSPYAFRRDELSYLLFGRLGYDPNTPESVFRAMLASRVGTDGLWDAVQAASEIVPLAFAEQTCGPDQRDYAPELELGGPVGYWATPRETKGPKHSCAGRHGAFDDFAMALPYDVASDRLAGRGTSRLSPVDVALAILAAAKEARSATRVAIEPSNAEARDVVRECVALADLGEWFAHKTRGATALAFYQGGAGEKWLDAARKETATADAAYTHLAADTAYIAPFEERMRMQAKGLLPYHWKRQLPHLADDPASIDAIAAEMRAKPAPPPKAAPPDPLVWLDTARRPGPGLASLTVTPDDPRASSWTVTATFAAAVPEGAVVEILHRPFRSDGASWASVAATGHGKTWKGTVAGTGAGAMFAVDVNAGSGRAWRYPDVMHETPYKALAP